MHPPINNAVQGAYFIAAFLTGVLFGGGSIIFADVTEGLSCLLGGFCLSMWFLVLTPGGLAKSTAGRAILIACFTLGTFAFYISHYTRPYALIGSISFAGATVAVLGIDCFSRAGLKEFWLYLWSELFLTCSIKLYQWLLGVNHLSDLNDALFPPHYDKPYPITRGIRVEIACIILIFLLGVMSQVKVWKIIKARRENRAALMLEEARRRDQSEEELGRRLEEGNEQERAVWEAVYGERADSKRQNVDSAIGTSTTVSVRKGSLSDVKVELRNSGTESIEMSNLDRSEGSDGKQSHETQDQKSNPVTVRIAPEDLIQEALHPSSERQGQPENDATQSQSLSANESGLRTTPLSRDDPEAKTSQQGKDESSATGHVGGPEIVPLPFKVPDNQPEQGDIDASSIATFATSDLPGNRISKRLSGNSLLRNLSKRPQSYAQKFSTSEEALVIPHAEDDRASSVAATVDAISLDHEMEGNEPESPIRPVSLDELNSTGQEDKAKSKIDLTASIHGALHTKNTSNLVVHTTKAQDGETALVVGMTPGNQSGDTLANSRQNSSTGEHRSEVPEDSLVVGGTAQQQSSEKKRDSNENKSNQLTKLSDQLSDGASKVVMAYRTNEWAKHLEGAEMPELEELNVVNTSGGLDVTTGKEAVAPVHIEALQQTAMTAEPAPILSEPLKQPPPLSRSQLTTSKKPSTCTPNPVLPNLRSQASSNFIERSDSQNSFQSAKSKKESPNSSALNPAPMQVSSATNRNSRSFSSPTAATPPIEEGVASSFPSSRFTPSPTHLMSMRDNMVRNKQSSTSLNRTVSASSLSPQPLASRESLISQTLKLVDEDDNIPLSQRKSLLQQQQQQQQQQYQNLVSRSSLALPHLQTLRAASNPRDSSTLTAWRSALRNDVPAQQAADQEIELRRSEMLMEKRKAETGEAWERIEREREQGKRGSQLRAGGRVMDELHREAMRKMQGEVNRKINPSV